MSETRQVRGCEASGTGQCPFETECNEGACKVTTGEVHIPSRGVGRRWSIETDEVGRVLRCEIEGVGDVAVDVEAVQITATPAEPPSLVMYLRAGVAIEGIGIVAGVEAGSSKQTVLAWLATLDAETLEKAALESMGMFGPSTTGEGFLTALRTEAETLP